MISQLGASRTIPGMVSVASMNTISAFCPGNLYFASAYPPIELNTIDMNVAALARKSELKMCV